MILHFVRHGESLFNAEGRIQGQTDVALSPFGQRQSAAVAKAISRLPIEAIYSSPLRRALQTAQPVAESLGLEIRTDDRLMEINAGVFQGLRWDEIERTYPAEAARWKDHDPDFRIPGGESRRDLMLRGRAAFEAIRRASHRQVVVVAHGGVLTAALKALLGIPAERNPFSLYNGSIGTLEWDEHVKLVTLNEVEHLREAGGLGRGGDL
ncbi:MAG: histidine phosphatase family protein [Pirellulales bacterium]|jgi:2,3-bisphosphoglycerate-dependent phosphoglycerate mutase